MADQKIEVAPFQRIHTTDSEFTFRKQHVPSDGAHATLTVAAADDIQFVDDVGAGCETDDEARRMWESKVRRHAAAITIAAVIVKG